MATASHSAARHKTYQTPPCSLASVMPCIQFRRSARSQSWLSVCVSRRRCIANQGSPAPRRARVGAGDGGTCWLASDGLAGVLPSYYLAWCGWTRTATVAGNPSRKPAESAPKGEDDGAESSGNRSRSSLQGPSGLRHGTPEGTQGADYIRRLAARLADQDDRLRRAGRHGLRAVGVLGQTSMTSC